MEYFDVCDEDGSPTGKTVSRAEAHSRGVLHRTAHVWIVREHGGETQVLLQKRSLEKDSFPGCWDTSSAGHIPAGDDPLASALRELHEELGIDAEPTQLLFAGIFRVRYEMTFHGRIFRDNEITRVYVYKEPVDAGSLVLQASEVDEVGWFGLDDVIGAVGRHDERFCVPPGGLRVLRGYLEKQKNLS